MGRNMRIVIFIILCIPLICNATDIFNCHLVGVVNGKKIELYPDTTEAYKAGIEDLKIIWQPYVTYYQTYAYCTETETKVNNIYNYSMSCANKKGGKQTAYYESVDSLRNYHCKSGCNNNVVKQFLPQCGEND